MSLTILEVLENAEFNLNYEHGKKVAKEQLHNVIVLLDKGYDAFDDFNEIMQDNNSVDTVKEKK